MGGITKHHIRKTLLQYRRLLAPTEYTHRNERLFNRLIPLTLDHSPKKLHLFLAMTENKEPDCAAYLEQIWEADCEIITTKTDFSTRSLTHHKLLPGGKLQVSARGIPEPENAPEVSIRDLDMIWVPLMAFDRSGHRIGYGGGYYDRILSQLPATTYRIGLSLSGGMDAFDFIEPHDQTVDLIVTPFETIRCK